MDNNLLESLAKTLATQAPRLPSTNWRELRIEHLNVGFTISIGCQKMAILKKSELIEVIAWLVSGTDIDELTDRYSWWAKFSENLPEPWKVSKKYFKEMLEQHMSVLQAENLEMFKNNPDYAQEMLRMAENKHNVLNDARSIRDEELELSDRPHPPLTDLQRQ